MKTKKLIPALVIAAMSAMSGSALAASLLGYNDQMKDVALLYDTGSYFSPGASCTNNKCFTELNYGSEQWINLVASGDVAKPSYSICTSISYDDQGKPVCKGFLAYFSVVLTPASVTLQAGTDEPSKDFVTKYLSLRQDPSKTKYFIESSYAPTPAPTLPTAQPYTTGWKYRGTNLAGAEFGTSAATANYPTINQAAYEAIKGVNTFRVPVRLEYAINTDGTLNATYINNLKPMMQTLLSNGYYVILDMHNYMHRCDDHDVAEGCQAKDAHLITGPELADAWTKLLGQTAFGDLAQKYPANFMLDLMNEPVNVDAKTLVGSYNTAIDAIRKIQIVNPILLEGADYSGLHSWESSGNAAEFVGIKDSSNNYLINVHQYFDANFSGTSDVCIAPSTVRGAINAQVFSDWLNENKRKAIVTEFGAPSNANCVADMKIFLDYMNENTERFNGWTTWSAGAFDDSYSKSFQGPTGPNYPLWDSLFIANNYLIKPTV